MDSSPTELPGKHACVRVCVPLKRMKYCHLWQHERKLETRLNEINYIEKDTLTDIEDKLWLPRVGRDKLHIGDK